MTNPAKTLTSGRLLARSTIWNMTGLAAPLLVGLIAIPLLIEGLGKERFGLLTIIWMGVGYFSLFDMGLGRALTKLVAERLGDGRDDELESLIWTALWLIFGMGGAGALILLIGSGPLIYNVLNVQPGLEQEAVTAFRILAAGLPFVIITAALVGILQAHQCFRLIMTIRIPLGALTFLCPLATLQFSTSLVWATLAMLVARIMASLVYFIAAARLREELYRPKLLQKRHIKPLFHFGGWLTVTNMISPLMEYFDRFLLGTFLTMTAVTYYVTPYEVLSRLQLLPAAVMGVIFPAMSTAHAGDRSRLVYLYERTARVLVVFMLPLASLFFLFAPEALGFWLGADFRQASTPVVQWLALGWLVNVMAQSPFTVLQSGGRPDLIAKTHAAELIPYGILLWTLTIHFGIAGTAAAWFLRVLVDAIILNEIARRLIPELGGVIRRTYIEIVGAVAGAGVALNITSLAGRAVLLLFITCLVFMPALRIGKNLLLSGSGKSLESPFE